MANEISLDVACKVYGISTRRYRQLAKEDKVPEPKGNMVDFGAATKAVVEYYRQRAEGRILDTEEAKREEIETKRLKRLIQEKKYLESMKKLVNADGMQKAMEREFSRIRTRLLHIPHKSALLCEGRTANEIREILDDNVRECLVDFAVPDRPEGADSAGKKSACAASKVKPKSVGGRKKGAQRKNKRGTR